MLLCKLLYGDFRQAELVCYVDVSHSSVNVFKNELVALSSLHLVVIDNRFPNLVDVKRMYFNIAELADVFVV